MNLSGYNNVRDLNYLEYEYLGSLPHDENYKIVYDRIEDMCKEAFKGVVI